MAEYKPQVVQLKQSGQDIIPITTAEAVLVNDNSRTMNLIDYINEIRFSEGDTSYTFNPDFFTVDQNTREVSLNPNVIQGIKTHICAEAEVKDNGEPDIANPDDNTIYLVPNGSEFNEYIYVERSGWELLGSINTDAVLTQITKLSDDVDTLSTQLENLPSYMITAVSPIAGKTIEVGYREVNWESIFPINNSNDNITIE